jgi:hypothetical protein
MRPDQDGAKISESEK